MASKPNGKGRPRGGSRSGAHSHDAEGLTPPEKLFLEAYIENMGNAAAAARRAGYSEKTARSKGYSILTRDHVQAALTKRREEIARNLDINPERVVRELARVSLATITDFVTWDEAGNARLKPSAKLSRDLAAAIKSVEQKPDGALKIVLHDKVRALSELVDNLDMRAFRIKIEGEISVADKRAFLKPFLEERGALAGLRRATRAARKDN